MKKTEEISEKKDSRFLLNTFQILQGKLLLMPKLQLKSVFIRLETRTPLKFQPWVSANQLLNKWALRTGIKNGLVLIHIILINILISLNIHQCMFFRSMKERIKLNTLVLLFYICLTFGIIEWIWALYWGETHYSQYSVLFGIIEWIWALYWGETHYSR